MIADDCNVVSGGTPLQSDGVVGNVSGSQPARFARWLKVYGCQQVRVRIVSGGIKSAYLEPVGFGNVNYESRGFRKAHEHTVSITFIFNHFDIVG
ncbi:hypothetical protein D3C76_1300320 [compost metagenome]